MSTLQGTKIKDTYPGLLKATDNLPLSTTGLRTISDGNGNNTPLQLSQQEVHISAMGVNGEIQLQSAGNVTLLSGDASNGLQINNTNSLFAGDVDFSLATVTGLPSSGGLAPVQLSGTSQSLDLGTYNFFDGGTLTGDTTLTFTNVPTEARFQYTYTAAPAAYKLAGSINANNEFVAGSGYSPVDAKFGDSGNKLYLLRGDATADAVYQFSLSTAYDVSTATYDSVSFSTEAQDNAGNSIFWKPDGTQFWLIGEQNDNVYQYDLTTAWDLSTASYSTNSFSVSAQESNPFGLFFKPDGTQFFILGRGTDRVKSFTMTTAWDITTASYDNKELNVTAKDTTPKGLLLSSDGTKVIFVGDSTKKVYSYNLSTAWDVSTGTFDTEFDFGVNVTSGNLRGITATGNGSQFIVVERLSNTVYTVDFGAAAINYPASVQNVPTKEFVSGDVVTQTFYTLDGGTNVYFEDEPQISSALPGMVAGGGTDAIASSGNITSLAAIATGAGAISIGNNSKAEGTQNITIGENSKSNGTNIINIGDDNDMSSYSDRTVLIRPGGGTGIAFRGSSVAIGEGSYPGAAAVAIGRNAQGGQNDANIVIGQAAYATGDSVAIGENTDALGTGAVALGQGAQATVGTSVALGYQVTASTANTVTLKRLQMLDYASLNYADDTAAATGGIPLGGVYHTDGALKIRIA